MSAITDVVKGLFEPARALISEVIEDKDKAAEIKATLRLAEIETEKTLVEYHTKVVEAQQSVVVAEAQGESWLQRNWRPILMLTFAGLVCAKWLGFTAAGVTEPVELALMDLIQIGVGGYVVGRSAEKIVPQIADILRKK